MITQIEMQHGLYENSTRLFLKFPYDSEAINLVKTLPQAKWSNTKKAWHISYFEGLPWRVINLFALKGAKVNYINEKMPLPLPDQPQPKKSYERLGNLPQHNLEKIETFKRWMLSRRYSENTIGTYCGQPLTAHLRNAQKRVLGKFSIFRVTLRRGWTQNFQSVHCVNPQNVISNAPSKSS